ncbi:dihydropteroate synthase [Oceanospirillum linum]|uniref:Dihydropteroate synthase n=1 Tax=Oceanospirillum linum TaxID=966 RepID=A0A1T1H8M4_OCELI|nr:dihydropteroate synthase [Oceanospirillum linum]OOV86224.1 dihydropteroate synthase [Oceanospirillum linum]SEG37898.1 Dihydropteroate synthase [Oleiphilus messinensis]SMP32234.1 Dihydropteroate synthase [Oceanospirillum linum]
MSNLKSRPFLFGRHTLDLTRIQVMGILNVTPDSFSDGGQYNGRDAALRHAEAMIKAGATLIDVGGESTRPGALAVSEQEELDRVIPVVEALTEELDALVSVDTSTASVIRESAKAGASLINDVRALEKEGALEAAAASGLPVCLMHMQGQPQTMQDAPSYADLLREVTDYLQKRANACLEAGIPRNRIILDPGYGFGKSVEHNCSLIKHLKDIQTLGYPLLTGTSRKSMLGAITGREIPAERIAVSVASALICAQQGAWILRVHDVEETIDALKVYQAVQGAE